MTFTPEEAYNLGFDTLLSFHHLFPQRGNLGIMPLLSLNKDPKPQELYTVFDLYCLNPECDCRKVTLLIYNSQNKPVATFSWGWKSVTFYRQWGLIKGDAHLLCEGFMDPLAPQSQDSPLFLKALKIMLRKDNAFKKIIKERYDLFKETIIKFSPVIELIGPFLQQQQNTASTENNIVQFPKKPLES
jgi:hypothetical protein